ncbi:MAG TPA: hypothetical protein ENJ64_05940 [Thiotrichales bacterium]|nr:hypothetical protein [Thiotrichales bacterium]
MNFDLNWLIGLHIPSALLPTPLLWLANGLFLLVLIAAVRSAPFRRLLARPADQHVYFGAIVMLLMVWGVKAGISPGLGFHHLGAALFTLMFGWPLAVIGLSTVLILSLTLQLPDWMSLGVNGVLSIYIPVMTAWGILKLSQKLLPDNFFIYIFVVAFFGAGVSIATSRLSAIVLLSLASVYPDAKLFEESLQYLPLFMFPEAFVTGMLISVFVVYKPEWVATFDDERYIIGK